MPDKHDNPETGRDVHVQTNRHRLDARRRDADDDGLLEGAAAVARYATQVGRRFAVFNAVERGARALEARLVSGVGERLRNNEWGGDSAAYSSEPGQGRAERAFYAPVHEPPGQLLDELLRMAARHGREEAQEAFHATLLRQLAPEEALVLAQLSDGVPRAVLHLEVSSRLGANPERAAGYFSLLTEEVALRIPERVPDYLRRLCALGLLIEGEPVTSTRAAHGRLQKLDVVHAAQQTLRDQRIRAKSRFASLKLSALGAELWQAAYPQSHASEPPQSLPGTPSTR